MRLFFFPTPFVQAWVQEGHKNNLYIIGHVGSVVQSDVSFFVCFELFMFRQSQWRNSPPAKERTPSPPSLLSMRAKGLLLSISHHNSDLYIASFCFCRSFDALVNWFTPICAAAPNLPFFYYHIPGAPFYPASLLLLASPLSYGNCAGSTKWAINVHDFVSYVNPSALLHSPKICF